MKFPKSLHPEGWANHIDTTPGAGRPAKSVASAPLHPPKPPAVEVRMNAPTMTPSMATVPPAAASTTPRVESPPPLRPSAAEPRAEAAALPPRDTSRNWMIPAGVGAAVIAALAVWAINRPAEAPGTPPAVVTGSVERQPDVAATTPVPEAAPAASRADGATTTAAAEPAAGRVGLPVTTVKPAAEERPVAQASVPPARPDLVVRANPRSPAVEEARPTPYLQPAPTVAAAPAPVTQPPSVLPGNAPIVMPPTAAGPAATTPQAVPPVAAATPEVTASAALAQAQPQPVAEDSGITVKVRTALAADAALSALPIVVSTDHGVVKLEGQAPDAQTRERATVVVAGTSGVKAVDNRLTLPPAAVLSQAPSGL